MEFFIALLRQILSPNYDLKLFVIANIYASPNLVVEKKKIQP